MRVVCGMGSDPVLRMPFSSDRASESTASAKGQTHVIMSHTIDTLMEQLNLFFQTSDEATEESDALFESGLLFATSQSERQIVTHEMSVLQQFICTIIRIGFYAITHLPQVDMRDSTDSWQLSEDVEITESLFQNIGQDELFAISVRQVIALWSQLHTQFLCLILTSF